MDEDRFNLSLRRFLKQVGITSQREIEALVRDGEQHGAQFADSGKLKVRMVLTAEGTGLRHVIEDDIDLR
ncbi:DUF6494 family protein [Hyphomicrobium sulfonivorans]|uniref:DUF6494 family protein n=1 Tax=Hyphomicrobium sulfonivorans TaxID=121290 RepID=UPI00156DBC93|nr:DUF6494 family protein [Hyphomicrobium sulfonivorans]MBI1649129.1 hypothetical protein [Hyphomicrobium sulfonivorans]NSL70340.1 hypothetical protein [Hyphomicrobium sulfonivorans]